MNKPWLPAILADPDFGTKEWRRRVLYEHAKAQVREQRRNRFIGQLVFIASLVAIGAILYWAAASLGLDVQPDAAAVRTGTVIVTATIGIALLVLAIFLWDARLQLDRSKIELMQRELERFGERR
jgi:uncharacterized membrane protein (DUF485 family)